MLTKIIGIDIAESAVSGVIVQRGVRRARVIACASVPLAGPGGKSEALSFIFKQLNPKGAPCYTAMAATALSFRNIELPFRDSKKIRNILPFELETMLPYSSDEILADFMAGQCPPDKTEMLVAAATRSEVAEFLAEFHDQGIEPELLGVRNVSLAQWLLRQDEALENGILLELGTDWANMICLLNRRVVLVRGLPISAPFMSAANNDNSAAEQVSPSMQALAQAVGNTVHAFLAETGGTIRPGSVFLTGVREEVAAKTATQLEQVLGIPVKPVDMRRDTEMQWEKAAAADWRPGVMDCALALALRPKVNGREGFDFIRYNSGKRKALLRYYRDFRYAVVLVLVILGLFVIDAGVDFYALKKQYRQIDTEVKNLFVETFPEVRRIVDPVQQTRLKVAELKKNRAIASGNMDQQYVLELLEDISLHIPDNIDVHVARLVVDREMLQLKGVTDTFNSVDSIKKGLEGVGSCLNVKIDAANIDRSGKKVQFELRAQLK